MAPLVFPWFVSPIEYFGADLRLKRRLYLIRIAFEIGLVMGVDIDDRVKRKNV